ncbi:MAG: hypothetical protein U5N55_04375 [Cypionkella sp.]|nr:hypothetical protein [Cypionkella sp.]
MHRDFLQVRAAKGADAVYDDARAIRDGGGNGSIIGRQLVPAVRAEMRWLC